MGDDCLENKGDRCRQAFGADASEGMLLEYLSADLQEEGDTCRGEQRGCRATAGPHQANYPRIEANYQGRQEESAGRERCVASRIKISVTRDSSCGLVDTRRIRLLCNEKLCDVSSL